MSSLLSLPLPQQWHLNEVVVVLQAREVEVVEEVEVAPRVPVNKDHRKTT